MQSISLLNDYFENQLKQIDSIIKNAATIDITGSMLTEILSHITIASGKRLRPILTLMSADVFSNCNANSISLAAAVEFIHTATLLHDDVIDLSSHRRGLKTANTIWGNKASILVGDYLFSQSFNLMVKTDSIDALRSLSKASSIISQAEIWQLEILGKLDMSMHDYIKLITQKTAVLFAAACEVGGISANANTIHIKKLYDYGLNFGIIFQIIDDYLDYFGQNSSIGKPTGGDFLENKITLPIILLRSEIQSDVFQKIVSIFNHQHNKTSSDFEYLLELMYEHDIKSKIQSIVLKYVERSINALRELPMNAEIRSYYTLLLTESTNRIS